MVRDAKVFLFDEPLSNLDAKLRAELRYEIKKLHRDLSNTMIYVTHDQIEAMTLADRISVMKDGLIQQLDTPKQIYNKPANLFVAGFIGSPQMNFLDANLNNKTLSAENFEIKNIDSDYNGEVTLGIRPEHLIEAENGLINLKVELVEQLGSDNLVYGQIKNIKDFCYRSPGNQTIKKGETLSLNIEENKYYIFDKSTGKRVN